MFGNSRQKLRQRTFMLRIEMLHEDESQARVQWQMIQ
jgi:hypothetical protein